MVTVIIKKVEKINEYKWNKAIDQRYGLVVKVKLKIIEFVKINNKLKKITRIVFSSKNVPSCVFDIYL